MRSAARKPYGRIKKVKVYREEGGDEGGGDDGGGGGSACKGDGLVIYHADPNDVGKDMVSKAVAELDGRAVEAGAGWQQRFTLSAKPAEFKESKDLANGGRMTLMQRIRANLA